MFTTMLGIWLVACGTETSPPAPALDPRDQYTLLREIDDAERGGDLVAYRAVRDGWQGRRLRWEVLHVPELCDDEGTCNVIPFDSARFDGIVRQGWLPRLSLDAAQRTALDAACDGHDRCVVTFEGTLSSFRFTPDELTRVAFDGSRS